MKNNFNIKNIKHILITGISGSGGSYLAEFIMNISSNSSIYGGINISTYSFTKAFMNTFTKATTKKNKYIYAISLIIGKVQNQTTQKISKVISINDLIKKMIYVLYNYKEFKNSNMLKLEEINN